MVLLSCRSGVTEVWLLAAPAEAPINGSATTPALARRTRRRDVEILLPGWAMLMTHSSATDFDTTVSF
jgi:hypothetical protein